ncbi:MAG: MFS transporter [Caulobacterales bacterium]
MAGLTHAGRIGYASGNLGKSALWSTLDYFFLFIITELWGLRPAEAGLIILVALVFDGLAAPIMGLIADRATSKHGKYGPFLAIGAPLCALSFALLLHRPPVEGQPLFWAVLGASLLFRACYTICDVPHNALFARVFQGPEDARLISGLRFFFSSLGAIVVGLAAGWVLADPGLEERNARLVSFAVIAGIVYVATLWWSWRATAAMDRRLPNTCASVSLIAATRATFQSPALVMLFAIAFVQAMSLPIFAKCLAFFAAYVARDAAWVGPALVALTLAQAFALPLWVLATRRMSSMQALIGAYVFCILSLLAFAVTARGLDAWTFASLLLIGAGIGGANMALWALLPEAIASGQRPTEAKVEALPTGFFLLAIKCGIGLGAGALGLALDLHGLEAAQPGDEAFAGYLIALMAFTPCMGLMAAGALALWSLRLGGTRNAAEQNPH